MTSILRYWNHTRVLHRQETALLAGLAPRLRGDGIQTAGRYFVLR